MFWNGDHWVPEPQTSAALEIETRPRHVAAALIEASLVAGIILLLITVMSPSIGNVDGLSVVDRALAARGGHGANADSHAGITINEATASLGGVVTFTTDYPRNVKNPRISVRCWQASTLVWATSGGVPDGYLLGGAISDWVRIGGAADCTADLYDLGWNGASMQEWTWLAGTTFAAGG
jgi:hypothetical protein